MGLGNSYFLHNEARPCDNSLVTTKSGKSLTEPTSLDGGGPSVGKNTTRCGLLTTSTFPDRQTRIEVWGELPGDIKVSRGSQSVLTVPRTHR